MSALALADDEAIVPKRHASAFAQTPLDDPLRERGLATFFVADATAMNRRIEQSEKKGLPYGSLFNF
jgi:hypothetical protein